MYGLETLLKWVKSHGVADARIVGDAIRIGTPGTMEFGKVDVTFLDYVRTVGQARAALGY